MSGDPEQDYFADGLVEDIITALSRLSAFLVIARNSTLRVQGARRKHQSRSAEDLGVRYVLEGSVRKAGGAGSHHRPAYRRGKRQSHLG